MSGKVAADLVLRGASELVTMDRRDALTLYRVAHEGFPTVGPLQ